MAKKKTTTAAPKETKAKKEPAKVKGPKDIKASKNPQRLEILEKAGIKWSDAEPGYIIIHYK